MGKVSLVHTESKVIHSLKAKVDSTGGLFASAPLDSSLGLNFVKQCNEMVFFDFCSL